MVSAAPYISQLLPSGRGCTSARLRWEGEDANVTSNTSQKRPPRKSMFHIPSVGWNNNFNLNPAEPWRVMNYFLAVVKAIKKNKQFTSGLKLTTQGTSITERYVGAQVNKHWGACTSWWLVWHKTTSSLTPWCVSLSTRLSSSRGGCHCLGLKPVFTPTKEFVFCLDINPSPPALFPQHL